MSLRGDAGCHQFGNAALNDTFCQFGIFQLVADGHTVTGFHQFMEISIQCMMRKTGELAGGGGAIISFGKSNTQNAGS